MARTYLFNGRTRAPKNNLQTNIHKEGREQGGLTAQKKTPNQQTLKDVAMNKEQWKDIVLE